MKTKAKLPYAVSEGTVGIGYKDACWDEWDVCKDHTKHREPRNISNPVSHTPRRCVHPPQGSLGRRAMNAGIFTNYPFAAFLIYAVAAVLRVRPRSIKSFRDVGPVIFSWRVTENG